MRRILLSLLLAFALLATPAALADGDRGRSDDRHEASDLARDSRDRHEDDDDDHDDDNETEDDRSAKREARHAERENWTANRTAILDRLIAQLQDLRASWNENATKIRDECHAGDFDHSNESKENRTARAHCIRDGYKEWRAAHRAELKEIHADLRALMEGWHKTRRHSGDD